MGRLARLEKLMLRTFLALPSWDYVVNQYFTILIARVTMAEGRIWLTLRWGAYHRQSFHYSLDFDLRSDISHPGSYRNING
jgi:hypothetical protein